MDIGTLFYVVGASGAGKDSLLDYARKHLEEDHVRFATRYITRPEDAGGENHISVSHADFHQLKKEAFFSLWWESHDNLYGISKEIDEWLKQGYNVVLNGSRGYLSEALLRYPDLQTVLIEVSEEVLRKRLNGRGRESAEAIEKRIERSRTFQNFEAPDMIRINNDDPLDISGASFVRAITKPLLNSSGG